jgi:hypothetical protein
MTRTVHSHPETSAERPMPTLDIAETACRTVAVPLAVTGQAGVALHHVVNLRGACA